MNGYATLSRHTTRAVNDGAFSARPIVKRTPTSTVICADAKTFIASVNTSALCRAGVTSFDTNVHIQRCARRTSVDSKRPHQRRWRNAGGGMIAIIATFTFDSSTNAPRPHFCAKRYRPRSSIHEDDQSN
jgi:hypothetical protein